MIAEIRKEFNKSFSENKYAAFLGDLNQKFNHTITFRVAESPIFVDKVFKQKLIDASNLIVDFLVRDDFKRLTQKSIPGNLKVPKENASHIVPCFGFCRRQRR